MGKVFAVFYTLLLLNVCVIAGEAQATAVRDETTDIPVPPPPMGWSSWNSFSNRINSAIAMQQAKALVDIGLARHGYRSVNIDEGWWMGKRDAKGNIVVDPEQWPAIAPGDQAGDMGNIVRYIHSLGLKAGIYTDAGRDGCSFYGPDLGPPMPRTGSEGHYEQDFLQFAQWGFDYVKVDWCGGDRENLDPFLQYTEIAGAVRKAERTTGHALFLSICNWGKQSPWTWAPGAGGITATIWRTSGDIVDPIVANSPNSNRRASLKKMLENFDKGNQPEAQHTGFYNDPDMMVLGMPGLTNAQNREHLTLWAISGAPLILGADLTTLTPDTLKMLENPDVLAIDQDALGLQAVRIPGENAAIEVWVKRLAGNERGSGRRAIVLLNRSAAGAEATVRWGELGLQPAGAQVRDVWDGTLPASQDDSFSATVPAGDARMFLVEGHDEAGMHYTVKQTPVSTNASTSPSKTVEWDSAPIHASSDSAWIRIVYENSSKSTELMELRIDGQRESVIALPPVAGRKQASVVIEARLLKDKGDTVLSFAGAREGGAAVISLEVFRIGRRTD